MYCGFNESVISIKLKYFREVCFFKAAAAAATADIEAELKSEKEWEETNK